MRLASALLVAGLLASPAGAAPKAFAFAPYVHATDGIDLAGWTKATGGRYLSLAFYNSESGQCRGAWPMDEAKLLDEVRQLRALGGDVIVSSGGWNADDLAARCPTPEALADVYDDVLQRFAADHLDLDPEPGDIHDNLKPEVVDRRSAATAILQKRFARRGKRLRVSFTIAVRPAFGFDPANLYVLQSALAHGVEIDAVNPMIMDYRDGTGAGEMGRNSLRALGKAQAQLRALYPGRPDRKLWGMLAATPMIGQNDAEAEVFTINDARMLGAAFRANGMKRIAFWSISRDNGGCPRERKARPDCSGLVQEPGAFARIFLGAVDPKAPPP